MLVTLCLLSLYLLPLGALLDAQYPYGAITTRSVFEEDANDTPIQRRAQQRAARPVH